MLELIGPIDCSRRSPCTAMACCIPIFHNSQDIVVRGSTIEEFDGRAMSSLHK